MKFFKSLSCFFVLFFINITSQAIELSYEVIDSQGNSEISVLKVLSQNNNIISLEIFGGTPEISSNNENIYLRDFYSGSRREDSVSGIAVIDASLVYVFFNTHVVVQKVAKDASNILVFSLWEDNMLKLVRHYQSFEDCREPVFMQGNTICLPNLREVSFEDKEVFYKLTF